MGRLRACELNKPEASQCAFGAYRSERSFQLGRNKKGEDCVPREVGAARPGVQWTVAEQDAKRRVGTLTRFFGENKAGWPCSQAQPGLINSQALSNSEGVLHLPLAIVLIVIVLSGAGIWGVMRHWRKLVETQLRLDKCVGSVALDLKSKLESISIANMRIVAVRIALSVTVEPATRTALEAELGLEVLRQEATRASWTFRNLQWVAEQGCGENGDFALPLPLLEWHRAPPDVLGPQPIRWLKGEDQEFIIQAVHSPRGTAAKIKGGGDGLFGKDWKAEWIAPTRYSGANIF